jgi:hypothetical protein
MKLSYLCEGNVADIMKQGQKVAQDQLQGLVTDPANLYNHIVRGLTYTQGILLSDEAYWKKMFAFWAMVTDDQKNEIFQEVARSVTKKLQAWQQTGQLQESVMGAVGKAIGGAVNWVGRQITGFAQFVAKIKDILDAGQGRQTTPGQRQQQSVVYSKLNAESVIGFVDRCTDLSQKAKKAQDEEAKKQESAQQPEQPDGPSQPQAGPQPA